MSERPPPESLADLFGGHAAAVDASIPPVAFIGAWAWAGHSLGWGVAAALVAGAAVSLFRLLRGQRPRAVLVSLLGVVVAGLVALRTGRPEDFFVLQILTNAASALAWAVSIALRWPLLGVLVGSLLGQPRRWRRDPALLSAYTRASWVWVCQYLLRIAVFVPLWWSGHVIALGISRVALSWPLVAATLALSWWLLRRSLPAEHPGLRHPVVPLAPAREPADERQGQGDQTGEQAH